MQSDTILAMAGGFAIQLVIFFIGYGRVIERLSNLKDSFNKADDRLTKSLESFGDKCDDIIANNGKIAERVSTIEGCLHAEGRGCGEKEIDDNSSQESQPVLRSN